MKIWVDDIRTPPDDSWIWCKTSDHVLSVLRLVRRWFNNPIEVMSLDHDLGISPYTDKEDTTRPIVLWMCENEFWPVEVRVHSANPTGIEWLESMINRYHPSNTSKHQMVPPNINGQYTCVECGEDWPCRIGSQND